MSSRLCKKCKQLLTPCTGEQFLDHILTCEGVPEGTIGVTYFKWPPDSPQNQVQTRCIGVTFVKAHQEEDRPRTAR
jgi:hypothetical protein